MDGGSEAVIVILVGYGGFRNIEISKRIGNGSEDSMNL